ncbi:acyl carrier protein [Akkermansiaceae bacterium]|jgi:D-alanine--poly(phosphoribitol) ligase subunit 2|nr:acyl carrier protein [Akkermansiaceae bacterium]|tara:strand:- start:44 stop:286 length:243 start_codon:yes stop_codon:yes gene_type:complete
MTIALNQLKQYLEDSFLFEFGEEITPTTDLFKAGLIDSYGYVELIRHIEVEYGFKLSEEELLSNVLVSLDDISNFVISKG